MPNLTKRGRSRVKKAKTKKKSVIRSRVKKAKTKRKSVQGLLVKKATESRSMPQIIKSESPKHYPSIKIVN